MSYFYTADTYELKANISKYLLALKMGWADVIIVKRYGRTCAMMIPAKSGGEIPLEPAIPPRSEKELRFYSNARHHEDGRISRRDLAEKAGHITIG